MTNPINHYDLLVLAKQGDKRAMLDLEVATIGVAHKAVNSVLMNRVNHWHFQEACDRHIEEKFEGIVKRFKLDSGNQFSTFLYRSAAGETMKFLDRQAYRQVSLDDFTEEMCEQYEAYDVIIDKEDGTWFEGKPDADNFDARGMEYWWGQLNQRKDELDPKDFQLLSDIRANGEDGIKELAKTWDLSVSGATSRVNALIRRVSAILA